MWADFPKNKHLKQAIYRGSGGAGDATGDATNASQLALAAADEAQASANTASNSATAAATSETNAGNSATAAATSATNAAASASTASTQATNASNSATSAANSASAASTSAANAASSASSASTSASAASTSATNAASSASSANTSATNASNSASAAATSATNAANSATSAASSATDAAQSATDAATTLASAALKNVENTFTDNQIISVTDNTKAALHITQLGTGNALLVEDSSNPDSTPFVIDASGNVISGHTSQLTTTDSVQKLQVIGGSGQTASAGVSYWNNFTFGPSFSFTKSRGGIGVFTSVNSGDPLGTVNFWGTDGTSALEAARIRAEVDGTPGTNDMPGRLVFSTTADGASSVTERMRINNAGNVGIGTSTPLTALSVYRASGTASYIVGENGGGCRTAIGVAGDNGSLLGTLTAHPLRLTTDGVEKARIDTSGAMLLGATSITGSGRVRSTTFDANQVCYSSWGNTNYSAFQMVFNASQVGTISCTASTTSYNTSSDYRLKENVQPMQGALATVAQLKPVTYNWKADGSDGQGFIAHELQEVVPDCVTGEKDAVDADGNPVYQGIDTSFLVATLTAAIQEQQAIIESLKTRIETLENK